MPTVRPEPFVIRGGLFARAEDVLTAVQDAFEDGDGAVLSVHVGRCESDEDFDAALARVSREADIRNNRLRVARLAAIEEHFEVVADQSDGQPACHHHVIFQEPPTLEEANLFVGCFDEPIPNPARSRP